MDLTRIASRVAILFGGQSKRSEKAWGWISIKLDPKSNPFYPTYIIRGEYIDPTGRPHETEFTLSREVYGREVEFEPESGFDIWEIHNEDYDAIAELWDLLSDSRADKQLRDIHANPTPAQQKVLDDAYDDEDITIEDVLKA